MAIVRVDTEESEDEEIGWSWKDVEGYDEQIVVASEDTVEFLSEYTGRSHCIARAELPHWIKALTEAQKYFDKLEINQ
jgi:hypothetical protein